ncbi:MAG: S-layer protein domain-containing protein, partial [Candidatus Methanoperedens sp.]
MSKKITAIALAALMLLIVALPAGAVIQATSVEVRGNVVSNSAASWNATTFAGFWYDLKDDLKTENLNIISQTLDTTDRDINADTLWYNTSRTAKTLKVQLNGKQNTDVTNAFTSGQYYVVGWQAAPYVAVKGKA